MNLMEKVEAIETLSTRSLDWYYHGIPESQEAVTNILTEGIKCAALTNREGNGNNGRYYISLSKDIGVNPEESAFHGYRRCVSNIIIDNIEPRKCINFFLFHFLANTTFPIRCSGFKDEFQAYKIIKPDKFIGLQCPLYYWSEGYYNEGVYKYFLESFKNIILIMKTYGITLPIYDYTRLEGQSVHLVNPDAYLEIYDESVERLTPEEQHILKKIGRQYE